MPFSFNMMNVGTVVYFESVPKPVAVNTNPLQEIVLKIHNWLLFERSLLKSILQHFFFFFCDPSAANRTGTSQCGHFGLFIAFAHVSLVLFSDIDLSLTHTDK